MCTILIKATHKFFSNLLVNTWNTMKGNIDPNVSGPFFIDLIVYFDIINLV